MYEASLKVIDTIIAIIAVLGVGAAAWVLLGELHAVIHEHKRKKERYSELLLIEYEYHQLLNRYNELLTKGDKKWKE